MAYAMYDLCKLTVVNEELVFLCRLMPNDGIMKIVQESWQIRKAPSTLKHVLCKYECFLEPLYRLVEGAFKGFFDLWKIHVWTGCKAMRSTCAFKGYMTLAVSVYHRLKPPLYSLNSYSTKFGLSFLPASSASD